MLQVRSGGIQPAELRSEGTARIPGTDNCGGRILRKIAKAPHTPVTYSATRLSISPTPLRNRVIRMNMGPQATKCVDGNTSKHSSSKTTDTSITSVSIRISGSSSSNRSCNTNSNTSSLCFTSYMLHKWWA
jgi:hypothetical protein